MYIYIYMHISIYVIYNYAELGNDPSVPKMAWHSVYQFLSHSK